MQKQVSSGEQQAEKSGEKAVEQTQYREAANEYAATREKVHNGMAVFDSSHKYVGSVQQVRLHDFLLKREQGPEIFIPYSHSKVAEDQIHLAVNADQIDKQGWETPDDH